LKADPSFRTTLTAIWERLLKRPHIGIEEDFFELGGDPSLAVVLFAEIARVCGRRLPPEMIYVAPTINSLAALLEKPVPPRFPPLVLLKNGTRQPTIFITHGLGASISELFEVVNHIRSKHPIYGMQAKGIDGFGEPSVSIEEMAKYFLKAVKRFQPCGPYCLIGYSLGGLVTLEMAQRLSASGDLVGLLAMLDSYPHAAFLPSKERFRLLRRRIRTRVTRAFNSRLQEEISATLESTAGAELPASRSTRNLDSLSGASSPGQYLENMQSALLRYRPRFYRGKVRFVQAAIGTRFPENPATVWGHLIEQIEIQTVPSDHRGMITTHAKNLGRMLSTYIEEELPEL